MAVYKTDRSAYYLFDFSVRGVRFHGSTGCTTRREAEKFEAERREAAKQAVVSGAKVPPMTVNTAMAKFWDEVGKAYQGNYNATFFTALCWITDRLGKSTLLSDIDKAAVAGLIAARRSDGVSNATINRTVIEPLRRVLYRAKKMWGQPVQEIDWRSFMLAEPKERIRELRDREEARIFEHLRADYQPIIRFALLSGCRLAECVGLRWDHVDWGGRTITIHGKGGKVATIPITSGIRATLWPLREHHPEAVFTYVAEGPRVQAKGERLPITYEGLKTQWRRLKANAKLGDFRFHDIRHTAATRLLRSSGNLKLVQKLLRHEDVATTTKYAHADDEDLRRAMEEAGMLTAPAAPDAKITEVSPKSRRLRGAK